MVDYSILDRYPSLGAFILKDVGFQSSIGAGSFGRIDEAVVPTGAAARRLHDTFAEDSEEADRFMKECELMSTLRHPNIVRFYGIAFRPETKLPAIVMERMAMSLHNFLDEIGRKIARGLFSLNVKVSVLHNVACGLAYLHERPRPIMHRDLSAGNVLLDSEMVAKISDFGTAHEMKGSARDPEKLTWCPGNINYMPPEAISDVRSYDVTIDTFSFGVLVIFTLGEEFPGNLLPSTEPNENGSLLARSEIERRSEYLDLVREKIMAGIWRRKYIPAVEPILKLIDRCLENAPYRRPDISNVTQLLERALSILPHPGKRRMRKLKQAIQIAFRNKNLDTLARNLTTPENADLHECNKDLKLHISHLEKDLDKQTWDKKQAVRELEGKNEYLQKQLKTMKTHEEVAVRKLTEKNIRLQRQIDKLSEELSAATQKGKKGVKTKHVNSYPRISMSDVLGSPPLPNRRRSAQSPSHPQFLFEETEQEAGRARGRVHYGQNRSDDEPTFDSLKKKLSNRRQPFVSSQKQPSLTQPPPVLPCRSREKDQNLSEDDDLFS